MYVFLLRSVLTQNIAKLGCSFFMLSIYIYMDEAVVSFCRSEMTQCLGGHTGDVLASCTNPIDGATIVTAGSDRNLREWYRSGDQLFLNEERDRLMENELVDQQVLRGLPPSIPLCLPAGFVLMDIYIYIYIYMRA